MHSVIKVLDTTRCLNVLTIKVIQKNEVINKWKLDINNRKDQLSGDQGIKCGGEEITLIDYNDTLILK